MPEPMLPAPPASGPVQPLALAVSAARVGGYRWVEQALYQLLGSWVADTALPVVQVHLDAQAARHAWHAELWAARLPVRAGVDRDALTLAPPQAGAALAALAGAPGAGGAEVGGAGGAEVDGAAGGEGAGGGRDAVLARLAGLYRVVLPRLVVSYQGHLALTSPVTDAPVVRALRLVLADEIEDWQAGERLVQGLLTPGDLAAVHAAQRRVEEAVVAVGTGPGPVAGPVPGT